MYFDCIFKKIIHKIKILQGLFCQRRNLKQHFDGKITIQFQFVILFWCHEYLFYVDTYFNESFNKSNHGQIKWPICRY